MDSTIDYKIITTDAGQEAYARAIAEGLIEFLNLKKASTGETENKKETAKSTSYTVKVVADILNVRSGAGTNYKVNTTIKKNEVYTIVEEKNGWGKLKSGAGWICLSYTEKTGVTVAKSSTVKYFKKYVGRSNSIAEALKNVNVDSSFSYRSKIAKRNNIKNYKGTAEQNTQMLKLLKLGILLKP